MCKGGILSISMYSHTGQASGFPASTRILDVLRLLTRRSARLGDRRRLADRCSAGGVVHAPSSPTRGDRAIDFFVIDIHDKQIAGDADAAAVIPNFGLQDHAEVAFFPNSDVVSFRADGLIRPTRFPAGTLGCSRDPDEVGAG